MKNLAFSLADITYEQGLQLLSLRKQALDSGTLPRMPKTACTSVAPLQAIGAAVMAKAAEGKFWDNENLLRNTALLGVAGAGAGAAAGLGFAKFTDKNYKRRALQGGLAGGLLGGGLGYLNTAEAPADPNKLVKPVVLTKRQQAEFDRIRKLSGTDQAVAIRDLTEIAGSSSPAWNLATGAAVGVGGGAAVSNLSFADKQLVAKHIHEQLGIRALQQADAVTRATQDAAKLSAAMQQAKQIGNLHPTFNIAANPVVSHNINDISLQALAKDPGKGFYQSSGKPMDLADIAKNVKVTTTLSGLPHKRFLQELGQAFPDGVGKMKSEDIATLITSKRFGKSKSLAALAALLLPTSIGGYYAHRNSNAKADSNAVLTHLVK